MLAYISALEFQRSSFMIVEQHALHNTRRFVTGFVNILHLCYFFMSDRFLATVSENSLRMLKLTGKTNVHFGNENVLCMPIAFEICFRVLFPRHLLWPTSRVLGHVTVKLHDFLRGTGLPLDFRRAASMARQRLCDWTRFEHLARFVCYLWFWSKCGSLHVWLCWER